MKSIALACVAALLALGCNPGRKSASGFRLQDGDPERGRAAFLQLHCADCHRLRGLELTVPMAHPDVPVILGGRVPYPKTDGELVTSIIYPSYRIVAGYPRESVMTGEKSRMPDMSETITARQLEDLVAFLQSRYDVVPPQPVR